MTFDTSYISAVTPIFIIGYPASGKTTFGRALAKALHRTFIDLDLYIENRYHSDVSEIFAARGEDGFRKIEQNMLQEVGEMENVVIACGGGTPCFFDNMEYMNIHGLTVRLNSSVDVIIRRLLANRYRRPLLQGKDEDELREHVCQNMAAREPFYSQAKISFEGDELENRREIETSVNRFLSLYPIKTE
jgi:shikimate kinase